jgi:membrane associated rhomboid family serine protease
MFSHGGIAHLLINMFVLFSLGGLSERIIGRKRFFWFYIISGIFAGLLSVVLSGFFGVSELGARIFGSPDIFMVGASGAIFAIAGLYVVLLPKLKFAIIFFPFFSFPGYVLIPLVLFGVWALSIVFGWPVGNVAHFGGFIVGLVYGFYLKNKYKRKVKMLQRMIK